MSTALAISGSPSGESRSKRLLVRALERLERAGVSTTLVDLCDLPADDLLGRTHTSAVTRALSLVADARIVVIGTPVYRAAYSGLLKVFFDLLPQDALADKVAIVVATGGGPAHQLAIDHALRPLLASVGALVVATGVYGTDSQFTPEGPQQSLTARIDRAVAEALAISGQFSSHTR